MHRGGQGRVVVGSRDSDSPAAGKRGGQLIGRRGGFAGLEESQASGKKDEDDAEDDILNLTYAQNSACLRLSTELWPSSFLLDHVRDVG